MRYAECSEVLKVKWTCRLYMDPECSNQCGMPEWLLDEFWMFFCWVMYAQIKKQNLLQNDAWTVNSEHKNVPPSFMQSDAWTVNGKRKQNIYASLIDWVHTVLYAKKQKIA